MIILKFIGPIIILTALWFWNKYRREKRLREESEKVVVPCFEFSVLGEDLAKKIGSKFEGAKEVINKLTDSTIRAFQVYLGEEIIGVVLFSWPSGLWRFRKDRDESETLGSYSHIHYLMISPEHRGKGLLYKLMDMVISDTHKISSGITIDLEDPELKELFRKKFEFKDTGSYMILEYGNWS